MSTLTTAGRTRARADSWWRTGITKWAAVLVLFSVLFLTAGCGAQPPALPELTKDTFPCQQGAAASGVDLAVNDDLANARAIFQSILDSGGSSADERICAAEDLKVIDGLPAKPQDPIPATASAWNKFYANWISPTAQFGVPWLLVFVLLLGLSRLLTRLVRRDRNDFQDAWVGQTRYWLGVAGLSVAAALLTIGSSGMPWGRSPEQVGIWALGLWVIVFGVAACLPLGHETWKRLLANIIVGAIVVGAVGYGLKHHWPSSVLLFVPTGLLIAASVWQVALVRGLHLGLVVNGRKSDGSADTGTAQLFVQRLNAMGANRPRGLQVPNTADIDPLPGGAISLLPRGSALQMAATFLVQLFTQSRPWEATVSQIDDRSVELVLNRNGWLVFAQVITAATVSLPPATATKPTASDDKGGPAAPNPPLTASELVTAAAAAALFKVSRHYPTLRDSLEPVEKWESLAAQSIALSGSRGPDDPVRKQLLAVAADLDASNWSAAQALALRAGNTLTLNGAAKVADALSTIDAKPYSGTKKGPRPVQIRTQFNLTAVQANVGMHTMLGDAPRLLDVDQPRPLTLPQPRTQLNDAVATQKKLDTLLNEPEVVAAAAPSGSDRGLSDFVNSMTNAALYARITLFALTKDTAFETPGRTPMEMIKEPPASTIGHIEQICGAAVIGDWTLVLSSLGRLLDMAPQRREWAQTDPYMAGIRRAAREVLPDRPTTQGQDPAPPPGVIPTPPGFAAALRKLIFDPIPDRFIEMTAVFDPAESTALVKAGVITAQAVSDMPVPGVPAAPAPPGGARGAPFTRAYDATLQRTLDVTAARAAYLHEIAVLAETIGADDVTEAPQPGTQSRSERARGWLTMLIGAAITSVKGLAVFDGKTGDAVRKILLDHAGTWQATLPGDDEITGWGVTLASTAVPAPAPADAP